MRMYSLCLLAYLECLESSLGRVHQAGWECIQGCTSELTWDRAMKGI